MPCAPTERRAAGLAPELVRLAPVVVDVGVGHVLDRGRGRGHEQPLELALHGDVRVGDLDRRGLARHGLRERGAFASSGCLDAGRLRAVDARRLRASGCALLALATAPGRGGRLEPA